MAKVEKKTLSEANQLVCNFIAESISLSLKESIPELLDPVTRHCSDAFLQFCDNGKDMKAANRDLKMEMNFKFDELAMQQKATEDKLDALLDLVKGIIFYV